MAGEGWVTVSERKSTCMLRIYLFEKS